MSYLETNLMGNWITADASLVMIYLDDLPIPVVLPSMVFSSSLHAIPPKPCTVQKEQK